MVLKLPAILEGEARMVKSADTADLKSADLKGSWGFKSPSGHHRMIMNRRASRLVVWVALLVVYGSGRVAAQTVTFGAGGGGFALVGDGGAVPLVVEPSAPEVVRQSVLAFSKDVAAVSGVRPAAVDALPAGKNEVVVVGVLGQSARLDELVRAGKLDVRAVQGKWESAVTVVVEKPWPGVKRALVIAGSDRRGAAFAVFGLARAMGVSPWTWWADVPVKHHARVYVDGAAVVQGEPSVKYRGIFLNDEDWGLRPWAAKVMDPELHNIGPHTYARVFELLLRLRANTLWPAMHPGTLAFNAVPENAKLADDWGIVMGSSHSEALLRNNVGEWDEKRDGPWNFVTNREPITSYWEKRLEANGKYENFYTVGMRGVHDSGLENKGTVEEKARVVEDVMGVQRKLLSEHVAADVKVVPQVIWLYKESLDLYRAGMKVPDDVTLGWTDDNYGYIRQMPTVEEQKRKGGSGVYYHVSYWGAPYDYLWLATTPPAQMCEELTKAYDHGVRKYWVLNVGDLKPAEMLIDYFMQLGWDEPRMAGVDQDAFVKGWFAEQFLPDVAGEVAAAMKEYYALNFVRKPEFMGFNGYNDPVQRTAFNPLAWGDENASRLKAWDELAARVKKIGAGLPASQQSAFFELVGYPVEAAAAQNEKLLYADRAYLDAAHATAVEGDSGKSQEVFDGVQRLTAEYNGLEGGKWNGMMSADPHGRAVFGMPKLPAAGEVVTLPASWGAGTVNTVVETGSGFVERDGTLSMNAAHFARKSDGLGAQWRVLEDLGVSGASVVYGAPGLLGEAKPEAWDARTAPWLDYDFATGSVGEATVKVVLLPTFVLDAEHRLRFAVSVDGGAPQMIDAGVTGAHRTEASGGLASTWEQNVLSNMAQFELKPQQMSAGKHSVRLFYVDPGVVFEHVVVRFAGAAPAYPVPPETRH